eukprot:scaffold74615_cov72-Cyclotella_meneghiniana.AAC.4
MYWGENKTAIAIVIVPWTNEQAKDEMMDDGKPKYLLVRMTMTLVTAIKIKNHHDAVFVMDADPGSGLRFTLRLKNRN